MEYSFLNLTEENLALCCIICRKTSYPGVETKMAWLRERLKEDNVFRKLDAAALKRPLKK